MTMLYIIAKMKGKPATSNEDYDFIPAMPDVSVSIYTDGHKAYKALGKIFNHVVKMNDELETKGEDDYYSGGKYYSQPAVFKCNQTSDGSGYSFSKYVDSDGNVRDTCDDWNVAWNNKLASSYKNLHPEWEIPRVRNNSFPLQYEEYQNKLSMGASYSFYALDTDKEIVYANLTAGNWMNDGRTEIILNDLYETREEADTSLDANYKEQLKYCEDMEYTKESMEYPVRTKNTTKMFDEEAGTPDFYTIVKVEYR